MGRRKEPPQLQLVKGNPGKRPIDHGPQVEIEAPTCPSWLPKDAKAEWRYICAELKRYGLITKLDRGMLAAYVDALAMHKLATLKLETEGVFEKTPNGMMQQNIWMQIRNKSLEQIHKFGSEFGLSPAARARVKAEKPEQGDFFDQF